MTQYKCAKCGEVIVAKDDTKDCPLCHGLLEEDTET